MFAKVAGLMGMQFKTADGKEIQGVNLYVLFPAENVIGNKCDKFFVKQEVELPKQLKVGDEINISFNQYGKVEAVSLK